MITAEEALDLASEARRKNETKELASAMEIIEALAHKGYMYSRQDKLSKNVEDKLRELGFGIDWDEGYYSTIISWEPQKKKKRWL